MKHWIVLLAVAALAGEAAPVPDCSLVPGWRQKGPARSYVAENLFEYMNGNAEGYLIYQFVRMNGVTCEQGEDTIVIDISEMADPEAAYGIFTSNRDTRRPVEKFGMGGQIGERKAIFAKDKYYVELAANPAKDHSPALRSFVAAMEKRISGRSSPPDVLSWFPPEGLDRESIRMVPESVLGLRLLKRGYVAQYGAAKAFVVAEATPEGAAGVMEKLKTRIGQTEPVKLADEAFQANDRYLGRMCVFRKGRRIAGYANVPPPEDPVAAASKLAGRMP